jgi:tetratricopeptide (TPR) repeat protein
MSGPLRAVALAAALLLAWTAGRSELLWREWREWRDWREARVAAGVPGETGGAVAEWPRDGGAGGGSIASGSGASGRSTREAAAPGGEAATRAAANDAALLRALVLLAEALARREGAGPAGAAPMAAAGPPLAGGEAGRAGTVLPAAAPDPALARALVSLAHEGAADRAALAQALGVLAQALAEREAADKALAQARGSGGPAAGTAQGADGAAGSGQAAALASRSPAPPADPPAEAAAWALADRGYAALRAGDRRVAAESFQGALALAPAHPEARAWRAEERRLTRRLRLEGYSLLREAGEAPAGAVAASPVLGGASLAVTGALRPWPLARRPVEAFARYAASQPGSAGAAETGQVAVGLAWQPVPGSNATVAVERLIAAGSLARDDWALRVAGGREARLRGLTLSAYGEAGLIPDGADWFAGAQASLEKRGQWRGVEWAAGAGLWAAGQATDGQAAGRLDLGPLVRVRHSSVPAVLQIDWRLRAAGDARPGSGPAVTVASTF